MKRLQAVKAVASKRSKAIENLEAAFQPPPEGRRVPVPGYDVAAGARYAEHLVPARMSELVLDGTWTGGDHWRAVGPRHGDALIAALRMDQAGNSTFSEFLAASWRAGVVRYEVDFAARTAAFRLTSEHELESNLHQPGRSGAHHLAEQ